ncbi:cyclopropane-fatty-acyl-phospholipid synthase [Aquabacterium olei]|uniref:Cyclopropane-fatty-acyl-phospholipid synthase n=1 Tax=Aquabacterium olei TaxID=1296669 RepID=A0A2U8FP36_9BURK|nr:class I SAM-dependent methyltransferase [Aquabacterium olei]AWI52608.1 cyclopropane-fatty-acyl-phospholipid synthase [Aquabacterium olei]
MQPDESLWSAVGERDVRLAREILSALVGVPPHPMTVQLWNGEVLRFGRGTPRFGLVVHHPAPLCEAALGGGALRLADAYFRGEIDILGDLYAALSLKDHLGSGTTPLQRAGVMAKALMLRLRGTPTDRGTKGSAGLVKDRTIAFHYDVSNAFYRLWLDRQMVYSCAYFQSPDDNLDQAQTAKLEHICRKLRLQPGDRFLDIGCGWGALLIHAAREYGVRAHGITLSHRQLELARQRIAEAGLQGRVTVERMDYRDLPGEACWDKIASVGMFEHVGLRNLPRYFTIAQRLLVPGGLMLNHGITQEEDVWNGTLSTSFINRYVFPDGQLDRLNRVMGHMEAQGFEVWDVEGLRPHYAMTLRHWVRRLEARHDEAVHHVSEMAYRVWRLYMAASALQFEQGDVSVYQVLASRRVQGVSPLPLTRADVYAPKAVTQPKPYRAAS